jgi:hypothetical protein
VTLLIAGDEDLEDVWIARVGRRAIWTWRAIMIDQFWELYETLDAKI